MNPFVEKYSKEISKTLAKYPTDQKRSAVMPLLYMAQREGGMVTKQDMKNIGEICGISGTEVASIVGFYSLYYDKNGSKLRIQVCNDMPCALRGSDSYLQALSESLGIKPGETTPDGMVTLESVMCLAACDKAPMFQSQSSDGISYHENQTVDSTLVFIEGFQKGAL
jgi:NADH-quinone oxidoreductase subunit E